MSRYKLGENSKKCVQDYYYLNKIYDYSIIVDKYCNYGSGSYRYEKSYECGKDVREFIYHYSGGNPYDCFYSGKFLDRSIDMYQTNKKSNKKISNEYWDAMSDYKFGLSIIYKDGLYGVIDLEYNIVFNYNPDIVYIKILCDDTLLLKNKNNELALYSLEKGYIQDFKPINIDYIDAYMTRDKEIIALEGFNSWEFRNNKFEFLYGIDKKRNLGVRNMPSGNYLYYIENGYMNVINLSKICTKVKNNSIDDDTVKKLNLCQKD